MKSYGTTGDGKIDNESYSTYLEEIKPEEKNPDDREYIPVEPEVEVVQFDPLAYARETIDEIIINGDYFKQRLAEEGIDESDRANPDYLRIMHEITTSYLDENRDFFVENYGEQSYQSLRLFGTAPYAMQLIANRDAQEKARRLNASFGRNEIIGLNFTVANLIASNRKLSLKNIASQVEKYVSEFDPNQKGFTHNKMLGLLTGFRTEDGFEQACLYRANPNNTIRHGDANEDLGGIDYVVKLGDNPEMLVDIKSHIDLVAKKAGEHKPNEAEPYTKTLDGKYVYCPQFTEESFINGTFELDLATKIQAKNRILEHLNKMSKL